MRLTRRSNSIAKWTIEGNIYCNDSCVGWSGFKRWANNIRLSLVQEQSCEEGWLPPSSHACVIWYTLPLFNQFHWQITAYSEVYTDFLRMATLQYISPLRLHYFMWYRKLWRVRGKGRRNQQYIDWFVEIDVIDIRILTSISMSWRRNRSFLSNIHIQDSFNLSVSFISTREWLGWW